jgi:hypothetical protein
MPASSRASPAYPRTASALSGDRGTGRRWATASAPSILLGAALALAGVVAGLAIGQAMATRSAHQAGACIAINMAAALGYLDAEQQRQVRYALVTAINPDVDLFSGGRPRLQEACNGVRGR